MALKELAGALAVACLVAVPIATGRMARAAERPGVQPESLWECPATHPIKGYVSEESGRRVYFVPGNPFYDEANPERCYATEEEARRDGSRPERSPRPSPPSREVARRRP